MTMGMPDRVKSLAGLGEILLGLLPLGKYSKVMRGKLAMSPQ